MAKQIFVDENGNEHLVSGTINNAEMLPYDSNTNTKAKIDSKADESSINNVSLTCPRCPIASYSNTKATKVGNITTYGTNITFGTAQAGNVYLLTNLFSSGKFIMGFLYDSNSDKIYTLSGNASSLWVRSGADGVPASEFNNKSGIYLSLVIMEF